MSLLELNGERCCHLTKLLLPSQVQTVDSLSKDDSILTR